ncbi:carboxypeptidase-like regulatory domain-containing protein [Variovorax dokdonensis]|uniref:Carboxypeptidase-like regulatory domain-containing protein n=1 Tax=Variovorax dokdonensis TaxID=344883 RepID=A0ABT7NFR4_9BURK|nr:carboxypeptidase-like regulatory domain-containing protein [Variovorax dokdonensis]MDM0046773.1 carboxypeptidase-like regulatory domain-containing protein [Variovorax dokdonensis]
MTRFLASCRPLALSLAVLGAVGAAQAAVFQNPSIQMTPQGVEFMCGGSGGEERAFMEMVSPRWAASFQFAANQGKAGERSAVAGVRLRVRDAYNDFQLMDVRADGPFLLARLRPGTYTVEATMDGLTLIQRLNVVQGGSAKALFVWPSNLGQPVQTQAAL